MGYLTGPVNSLTDFQCEFAGLLMGAGTPYTVPSWDFLNMFSVKTMDVQRVGADGSWSGPDYGDVLTSTMGFDLTATSASAFDAAAAALEAVTAPQTGPLPFWYKLPLRTPRGIPFRVMQRSIPITPTWGRLAGDGALQWRCTEARGGWQSTPRLATLTAGAAQRGGLVFPLFKKAAGGSGVLDFGLANAASSLVLANAGNTDAWPYIVVTPPAAGLTTFTVTIAGHAITYTGAVGSGQQVVIDAFAGTAGLSGAGDLTTLVDRTYLLTARDWWPIPARSSAPVALVAAGGAAAVTYADMWR